MNQTNLLPKNEIDALWILVKKYKKSILLFTIIGFLLSFLYTQIWYKPVYKAIALVQIGKLNNVLIEPTKILNIKLNTQYSNMHTQYPKLIRVKVYDAVMGLIRLDAAGHSKESLEGYLKGIVNAISKEHTPIYTKYIDNTIQTFNHHNELVENYKKEILHLKEDIVEDENYLKHPLPNDQIAINTYTFKLLRDDAALDRAEKGLTKSNKSMISYRTRLLATKTYNTHLYHTVKLQTDLVNSRKSVILSVGVIAGFLFGLLFAFFLSLLAKKRD